MPRKLHHGILFAPPLVLNILFTAFGPGKFGAKCHLKVVEQFSMLDFRKISKVLRETRGM